VSRKTREEKRRASVLVCSSAEIKEEEETHQAQKESVRRHTEENQNRKLLDESHASQRKKMDGPAAFFLIVFHFSFLYILYLSVAESFRLDCRRILETGKPKITFSHRDVGHHHQRVSKDGGAKTTTHTSCTTVQ
jgi:hypothetical protein